jgi:hypothetical protein
MHDAYVVVLLRAKRHATDNNTPNTFYLTACKAKFDISSRFTGVYESET